MRKAIRGHPALTAGGVIAAVLVVLLVSGGGSGGDDGAPASNGSDLRRAIASLPLPELDLAPQGAGRVPGPRYAIAEVRAGEQVELRRSPGGAVITELGDRTEFGSRRKFSVSRVRGEWFGVPAPELPNGELGWIQDNRTQLELYETRYSLVADISARRLELRYGNRVVERFPVTVGSPGSPTPPGAYSITDSLVPKGGGPYYGCCILALSGHQPNLPPDWIGGDRIAIHGTPGQVGTAGSTGCLRARDIDMVSLFARVPIGAPVFIRA